MSDTFYFDGWYMVTGNGMTKVWWVDDGEIISGLSVDYLIGKGYTFKPVVVLSKAEHDSYCAWYVETSLEVK